MGSLYLLGFELDGLFFHFIRLRIMAAPVLDVLWHFVLIHGAAQDARSWYRLEDHLLKAGHNVTFFDLPGASINLVDPNTFTTWEESHKPALDFFQSLEPAPNEKVVLVGHSSVGIASLILMERFPQKIDLAVFVKSAVSLLQDQPLLALFNLTFIAENHDNETKNPPTSLFIPSSDFLSVFNKQLAAEVVSVLVRSLPYLIAKAIAYTREVISQAVSVLVRSLPYLIAKAIAYTSEVFSQARRVYVRFLQYFCKNRRRRRRRRRRHRLTNLHQEIKLNSPVGATDP